MKGIAIAMETIIYIILAVLVLTILLFFFMSQVGPTEDQLKNIKLQREACQAYLNSDPSCSEKPDGDALLRISRICARLEGVEACKKDIGSRECAIACCRAYCPAA